MKTLQSLTTLQEINIVPSSIKIALRIFIIFSILSIVTVMGSFFVYDKKDFNQAAIPCNSEHLVDSVLHPNEKQRMQNFSRLVQNCPDRRVRVSGELVNLTFEDFTQNKEGISSRYGIAPYGNNVYTEIVSLHGWQKPIRSSSKITVEGLKLKNAIYFPNRPIGKNQFGGIDSIEGSDVIPQPKEIKTLVLLGYFSDQEQPDEPSVEQVRQEFSQVDQYYRENSYGNISGFFGVEDRDMDGNVYHADVRGWYQVPIEQNCDYIYSSGQFFKAASQDVDFRGYNRVVLVVDFGGYKETRPNCNSYRGGSSFGLLPISTQFGLISVGFVWVQPSTFDRDNAFYGAVAHELGHTFGLGHASAIDFDKCPNLNVRDAVHTSGCDYENYGDVFDIMGYSSSFYAFFNPAFKDYLGWFNLSNVDAVELPGAYVFTLEPLETASQGLKSVKILKDRDEYFMLSYRQPISFDNLEEDIRLQVSDPDIRDKIYNGINIHFFPLDLLLNKSSIIFNPIPDPTNDIWNDRWDKFLIEGQSVELKLGESKRALVTVIDNQRDFSHPEQSRITVRVAIYYKSL